jgi:hypothetical protein
MERSFRKQKSIKTPVNLDGFILSDPDGILVGQKWAKFCPEFLEELPQEPERYVPPGPGKKALDVPIHAVRTIELDGENRRVENAAPPNLKDVKVITTPAHTGDVKVGQTTPSHTPHVIVDGKEVPAKPFPDAGAVTYLK